MRVPVLARLRRHAIASACHVRVVQACFLNVCMSWRAELITCVCVAGKLVLPKHYGIYLKVVCASPCAYVCARASLHEIACVRIRVLRTRAMIEHAQVLVHSTDRARVSLRSLLPIFLKFTCARLCGKAKTVICRRIQQLRSTSPFITQTGHACNPAQYGVTCKHTLRCFLLMLSSLSDET
jgi:hypothetical protein